MPNENSSTTDAVLRPMPGIARQPGARLERRQRVQELERVIAAALADRSQRGLDARRLLRREAARPDHLDQLGERRALDGRPVGRRGGIEADAAPARPVDLGGRPARLAGSGADG